MLITVCQKDGTWTDNSADCADSKSENCQTQGWTNNISDQMAFRVFEDAGQGNNIWDHIEWDKAPRGTNEDAHHFGEGDGWFPFYFSQCCTTVAIAPEI